MYVYTPIDISHKALFEKYIQANPCRSCDYSFTNIYTWKDRYHTEIAQDNDFLWARYREPDGRISYMMPLSINGDSVMNGRVSYAHESFVLNHDASKSEEDARLKSILQTLMAEAVDGGYPFAMQGVTRDMYDRLSAVLPDTFIYKPLRRDFDYLYHSNDLIQLSGKKYQPKRNHIHKLQSLPGCTYRPLQLSDIPACMEMTCQWIHQNHIYNEEFISSETESGIRENTIAEELQAIQYAFSHWEALGLQGGVLFLDEKMIAYTYGQPISTDTFGVHIEKADSEVDGAYPLINQLFAQQVATSYTYINREEDMGLAGLRKAKLSYHPVALIEKGEVTLAIQKQPTSTPELLLADTEMQAEIRNLWKICFPDDEDFMNAYFKYKYKSLYTLVLRSNDCIIASLQMLPYYYENPQGQKVEVAYMSGLCTLPEHRRKGYMERLLEESFRVMKERNITQSLLIPQEAHLIKYYEKFGYKTIFHYHPTSMESECPLDVDSTSESLEALCIKLIKQYTDMKMACICMLKS